MERNKRSKNSLQINSELSREKSNSEDMKATIQILQKFEDSDTTKPSFSPKKMPQKEIIKQFCRST